MDLSDFTKVLIQCLRVNDPGYTIQEIQEGLELLNKRQDKRISVSERSEFLRHAVVCATFAGKEQLAKQLFQLLVGRSKIGANSLQPKLHPSIRPLIKQYEHPYVNSAPRKLRLSARIAQGINRREIRFVKYRKSLVHSGAW